jgi:hypothetical protein
MEEATWRSGRRHGRDETRKETRDGVSAVAIPAMFVPYEIQAARQ